MKSLLFASINITLNSVSSYFIIFLLIYTKIDSKKTIFNAVIILYTNVSNTVVENVKLL